MGSSALEEMLALARPEPLRAAQAYYLNERPVMFSNGLGVDSWGMAVGMKKKRWRPDLMLFADVGGEKDSTYELIPVFSAWLKSVGFPPLTIVRYKPKKFKHWPPYHTLEDNCLTNGTLPSLAFGFKSCSLKWKVAPQNAFAKQWQPAIDTWALGQKVVKLIGYDAGPIDARRYAGGQHGKPDEQYEYRYPLVEWGWDRERCIQEIQKEGLPVPPKSSCFFCPSMKPQEVRELDPKYLRRIVKMEARAKPRLEKIEGLWRNGTSGKRSKTEPRPGSMTEFIRTNKLLSEAEIDEITKSVGADLLSYQQGYALALKEGNVQEFEFEHEEEDYREHGKMPEDIEGCCCH